MILIGGRLSLVSGKQIIDLLIFFSHRISIGHCGWGHKMSRNLAIIILLCLGPSTAHALDPLAIPSPRPESWILDRAHLISAVGEAEINARIDAVKRTTGGEIAVVTLPTIGGGSHRRFATRLFNHWGIGDAAADNGVLLLVASEDRAAELILGDGIDRPEQVRQAERIMNEAIVPRMRQGDPEGAIRAGVERVIQQYFPSVPDPSVTIPHRAVPGATSPETAQVGIGHLLPALVGGGGLSLALISLVRSWLRRRPRKCPDCGLPMVRLDEQADDAHLGSAEQLEETLGSVNYDVWLCNGCNRVIKLRHSAFYTQYARCPQCKAVTMHAMRTTLIPATEFTEGMARIDEHCKHCGYTRSYDKRLPRLPRSDSGSFDGGSSFGGGSSSGGGASGRW